MRGQVLEPDLGRGWGSSLLSRSDNWDDDDDGNDDDDDDRCNPVTRLITTSASSDTMLPLASQDGGRAMSVKIHNEVTHRENAVLRQSGSNKSQQHTHRSQLV